MMTHRVPPANPRHAAGEVYDKVLLCDMTRARISITIPEELLATADRRAAELECSRSWLVCEALREHLSTARLPAWAVSEPRTDYVTGLGPGRLGQLEADLALTPEQRVRAAEQTALVAELRGPAPQRDRVIGFDRIEDFLAWERRETIAP